MTTAVTETAPVEIGQSDNLLDQLLSTNRYLRTNMATVYLLSKYTQREVIKAMVFDGYVASQSVRETS